MALDTDPRHVFRDFVTDGIPATGAHSPRKPEIRRMFTEWWQTLIALVANQTGLTLPNLLIRYTVTGGDKNDIIAEPDLPVPAGAGTALFSISVGEANTDGVTINGKRLLTSSGNELVSGGLVSGIWLFLDDGDNFRLVSDQASQAIMNAAEQAADDAFSAKEDAEMARDIVENLASDAVSQGNVPIYSTLASIGVLEIPAGINAIRVNGRNAVGDGEGGLYVATDNGNSDQGVSGDGKSWYRVQDVGSARLGVASVGQNNFIERSVTESKLSSDVASKLNSQAIKDIYSRSVYLTLPIKFPLYDEALAIGSYNSIYPQSFCFDEVADEVWVQYEASGGVNSNNFITVWNKTTSAFKGVFVAGSTICEGLAIRYEGGARYLFSINGTGNIGKFDVTSLPSNLSTLDAIETHNVSVRSKFALSEYGFVASLFGSPVGVRGRYYQFGNFNNEYEPLSYVSLTLSDVGFSTLSENKFAPYLPKWQGFSIGSGFMAVGLGGSWRDGQDVVPYTFQGLRMYAMDGSKIADGVVRPDHFLKCLRATGYPAFRVENEGTYTSSGGDVFSLYVTSWITDPVVNPLIGGITIFKEMSNDDNKIDMSGGAVAYPRVNNDYGQKRFSNKLVNELTGGDITTFSDLLDYMSLTDIKEKWLYTSSTPLKDIVGNSNLPASTMIKIYNLSNTQFILEQMSQTENTVWYINGEVGSWVKTKWR